MLHRESSQFLLSSIQKMCGQNTEFLNVKPGSTYSDRGERGGAVDSGTVLEVVSSSFRFSMILLEIFIDISRPHYRLIL